MLKIAAVAIFGALSALGASRALGTMHGPAGLEAVEPALRLASHGASDLAAPEPAAEPATGRATGSDASITKAADGHYWAEGNVNGQRVRFLVDTGASQVALTRTDAMRLGLDPAALDYAYTVSTASGEARAARVQLASISVAGAQVRDVEALVIDHGLPISLLGMSYLGRLSRFEATPQALILRP